MKYFLAFCMIVLIASCKQKNQEWKPEWQKHSSDLKKVVQLLKNDELPLVYGRAGYAIPDSLDITKEYNRIVFRETDFTYDSSYSIIFPCKPDTSRAMGPTTFVSGSATFVYTNNKKRIDQYQSRLSNAIKIEENWYYVVR